MGLFSKSKKVNEYEEASNNLNNEATTLASERVIFEQIQDDDERAAFLVDQMNFTFFLFVFSGFLLSTDPASWYPLPV